MKPYKFCIAYENSSYPGYVTEKIMDCFYANCIPIYWGSPTVAVDFNPNRIINRFDFKSDDELIERIKFLNENETAYRDFINQPIFVNNQLTEYFDEERLRSFFERIFFGPKLTNSKGIKKQIGVLLRNLKKLESRTMRKLGSGERIWY